MFKKARQSRLTTNRRLRHELLGDRRMFAVIIVSTLEDSIDPEDGVVRLREAVAQANQTNEDDVIRFDADLVLEPARIDLVLGQINIESGMSIEGPGPNSLTIDAGHRSRIFSSTGAGLNLSISGLGLRGGRTGNDPESSEEDGSGPALLAQHVGITELANLSVIDNFASGNGSRGAITVTIGQLNVRESRFRENRTSGNHGTGAAIHAEGALTVVDTEFVSNSTAGFGAHGGAIFAGSHTEFTSTMIAGNETFGTFSRGGGVFASNHLSLSESIISNNRTNQAQSGGGGVIAYGDVSMIGTQIIGNEALRAQFGGGMLIVGDDTEKVLTIRDSSFRENSAPEGEGDNLKYVSQAGIPLRVQLSEGRQIGLGLASDLFLTEPIFRDDTFVLVAKRLNASVAEFQIQTDTPWSNPLAASDVNNSGDVSALDALLIINELNARRFSNSISGTLDAPTTSNWPGLYFDQNGDGNITALDALRVINELNRLGSLSSAAPEPFVVSSVDQRSDFDAVTRNDEAIALLF